MSVNPIFPDVFQGGQMTDLPVFTGTLNGTELMEIVAAPTGQSNAAAGVNYQVTTALLAALFTQPVAVIITQGQYTSPGSPYVPGPFVGRVYVDKPVAEATYIALAAASTYYTEPLVKDVAGTAAPGNAITVTFAGGQSADGFATVPINSAYGGYFFRPVAAPVNNWTLGSA